MLMWKKKQRHFTLVFYFMTLSEYLQYSVGDMVTSEWWLIGEDKHPFLKLFSIPQFQRPSTQGLRLRQPSHWDRLESYTLDQTFQIVVFDSHLCFVWPWFYNTKIAGENALEGFFCVRILRNHYFRRFNISDVQYQYIKNGILRH
jgi:hypothetical protein